MPRAPRKPTGESAAMLRRLRAMLRYLPALERRDPAGQWHPMKREPDGTLTYQGFESSELTLELMEAAYRHHWVLEQDWQPRVEMIDRWEAAPDVIDAATIEDLARGLTFYLRLDRFSEGTWARAIQDGIVLAIVRRMQTLAREIVGGTP